jgi:hypothetical protein
MRTLIVRLWHPTAGETDAAPGNGLDPELHGRIEDPLSGQERSFASGHELIEIIGDWMKAADPNRPEVRKG